MSPLPAMPLPTGVTPLAPSPLLSRSPLEPLAKPDDSGSMSFTALLRLPDIVGALVVGASVGGGVVS